MNGKLEGSTKIEHGSFSPNPAQNPEIKNINSAPSAPNSNTAAPKPNTAASPATNNRTSANSPAIAPTSSQASTPSQSSPNQPNNPSKIQFHSGQIEANATKKIDPFAKQNQAAAEKSAQNKKRRKIGIIVAVITGILVLAGGITAAILLIQNHTRSNNPDAPSLENASTESIINLKELAENAYVGTDGINPTTGTGADDLAAAEKIYDDAIAASKNRNYIAQIQLSKIIFYSGNGYNEKVIATAADVNIDDLTIEQKKIFYNMLMLAYYAVGNEEEYNKYQNLMMQAATEQGGQYGA